MSGTLAASKLPATIGGRYVPVRLIGQGGMGAVYEVEHNRTGERLALKVLLSSVGASAEALERFKREARASARIKSDNVVRVTDADVAAELDGAPFLVMELLVGGDLEHEATASKPTPATAVDWLRQVALAIDKAHRLGIVHRDLKPENLFLSTSEDRPPTVKILDFGIAKMAQEGAGATSSGQVLGTPKYMAPEQATGSANVTPATDLYALGLIGYRLIMGVGYYQTDSVMSILGELLHGRLRPPSEREPRFGAAFDAWFTKACARDPAKRFTSAADQVEALAESLGLPRVSVEPAGGRRVTPASSPGSFDTTGTIPVLASASSIVVKARAAAATPDHGGATPTLTKSRRVFFVTGVLAGLVVLAVLLYSSRSSTPDATPGKMTTAAVTAAAGSTAAPATTPAAPSIGQATPTNPVGPVPSASTQAPAGVVASASAAAASPAEAVAAPARTAGKPASSAHRPAAVAPRKPTGADPWLDQK